MGNTIEIRNFAAGELDVYARLTEAQLLNRTGRRMGFSSQRAPRSSGGPWTQAMSRSPF